MTRTTPRPHAALTFALVLVLLVPLRNLSAAASGQNQKPTPVEPSELTRRPELVGREIAVEDRVGRFQYYNETKTFDEIYLKRAPDVPLKLPPRLRSRQSPSAVSVSARGVLQREGDAWWVDVTAFEPLPGDLDRLNRAVSLLARSDVTGRSAWAKWALRRGTEFARIARSRDPGRPTGEEALLARAREIQAEVIRDESDHPPAADPAGFWLGLAERARADGVPEPEPSAQAHRGFRAALSGAKSAESLGRLAARIGAFFPAAAKPPGSPTDLGRWDAPYARSPADAYRAAPPEARAGLDRRLWADATETRLRARAAEDPSSALALADEAARLLPDRPAVAPALREAGLSQAARDVGRLRLDEVEALARTYRDDLHQPDRADALVKSWLDDQKDRRLSPRDAEGRVALAEQYREKLHDEATASALLRDAWAIDPGSREVSAAFRRLGYRKVGDEWVEPGRSAPASPPADPDRPGGKAVASTESAGNSGRSARAGTLLGSSPDEVVRQMGGKPRHKTRIVTRAGVTEQWVYERPGQTRYVNFFLRPGDRHPLVVSDHPLSRPAGARIAPP